MGKVQTIVTVLLFASLLANGRDYDIHDYMTRLSKQNPCEITGTLVRITDVESLHTQMTEKELTAFLLSSPSQTKAVYSFAKKSGGTMTPLEFSHFLVDDLFHRKVLQALISKTQRESMILWLDIMETANRGKPVPKERLDDMVLRFGAAETLENE